MIGYLKGQILDYEDGRVLLGVGLENGQVGYSVMVPQLDEVFSARVGMAAEYFIYTHVREEALDLYGFSSKEEKSLFLILLSVSGIGPKSALQILSKVKQEDLLHAIISENSETLTQIPGIGKKTAERMVVELKDSIKKKIEKGILKLSSSDSGEVGSSRKQSRVSDQLERTVLMDTRAALSGLGFREVEIQRLVSQALKDFAHPPGKAEDLIRRALRYSERISTL